MRAQVDHDQAPSWLAHAIARPSGLAGRETTVLEEVRQEPAKDDIVAYVSEPAWEG